MRVVFHPQVYSDLTTIQKYYERVATRQLADDFYREFRLFVNKAVAHPELFAVRERNLRRVNLRRFPYHFLFRLEDDAVRVLVVRHHHRSPAFGTRRR